MRSRRKARARIVTILAAVLAFAMIAGEATAQAPVLGPFPAWPGNSLEPAAIGPRSETVFNRPRPDYDPLGVRWGSFIIDPSIALSGTYDSNIFATQTGAVSDFFAHEIPAMTIRSDWNQNALGANISGDFRQYVTHTTENVNNFSTDVGGRYDISNGEYFAADGLYQLLHEDRSSPNAVDGKYPTQYVVMGGDLSYVHMVGVLGLRIDSTFTSYSFNNAVNGSTGATINQQFRNRNEYVIAPRVQYEIEPGYNAFLRVVGNERQYFSQDCTPNPCTPTSQGIRRNSHGWEVDAGTAIEITRILAAEVYVGYLHQHYENPLLKSPSGVAFGGNVIWNATELTSVIGSFSQSVAETTLENPTASSSLETGVQLTVQHELLRNLLLLGSVGYVHDQYQGNPRVDGTLGVDAGVKYL
ncbi:MAG TPA: outer membrane beta-barrel protein, partial [Stellaceae bacterium]|nr:outer membrane beta-barrel protein [Stellaceae bacterium]